MNRLYIYKCVVDDGGAPCVQHGLLSLCICKPRIRSTADKGDIIFAFGSNNETPANRLVYIAVVTKKLTGGEYYERREYRVRCDCIYERTDTGRFRVRPGAKFHGSQAALIHDLGPPPEYPRANSLLSNDFRYFGANGTAEWKQHAPTLTQMLEDLRQGHRIVRDRGLRDELLRVKRWAWQTANQRTLGKPLHAFDCDTMCDDERTTRICRHRC